MQKRTGYHKIIRGIVNNRLAWKGINILSKIVGRFVFEKDLQEIEKKTIRKKEREKRLRDYFCDLVVRNGIFKGMKYPEAVAHGSAIYGKLLGSYESELTPIIKQIVENNDYTEIIDVGCAEGYYAVGFALKMPWAKIYAYDINPLAIKSCEKMAVLNNVSDRIITGGAFTNESLKNFNFSKKSLVVCDCEGYEIELFDKENIANLKKCDVLIELHDIKNERISPYLFKLFEESHDKIIVQSINCFAKVKDYAELKDFTDDELQICLAERKGIMEWVFFTSKKVK